MRDTDGDPAATVPRKGPGPTWFYAGLTPELILDALEGQASPPMAACSPSTATRTVSGRSASRTARRWWQSSTAGAVERRGYPGGARLRRRTGGS